MVILVTNKEIKQQFENRKQGIVPDNESQKIKVSNSRICQNCAAKNSLNAKFCIECGEPITKISLPFSDMQIQDVQPIENDNKMNNSNDENIAERRPLKISETNPLDEIRKAKELLDMGAITEGDYEIIKNKYLEMI